jgi:HTH-type transcriptional regulator, competence development regulator
MITEIGKYLRHLRVDHDETLKDMAAKLNVSSAYVSSVECGKRAFPDKWIEILNDKYNLNESESIELEKVVSIAKSQVNIEMNNFSDEQQDISIKFARNIKNADPDLLSKLQKLLDAEENKNK